MMSAIIFGILERIGLSALSAWLQRNKTQEAIDAQNNIAAKPDAAVADELRKDWTRK